MSNRRIISIGLVSIVIGLVFFFFINNNQTAAPPPATQTSKPSPSFNKKQFSLDDPSSFWVIVNKKRPLNPKDYAPSDLRTPKVALRSSSTNQEMTLRDAAASALEEMFAAAAKDSIYLLLASGYRSFSLQTGVYNRNVSTQGQKTADSQSARPGYSEHQTGLAVDVGAANRTCEIETCFADMPEGQWVATNAHRYGFVIRYPQNAEKVVGYIYEPWHLRFVGRQLAAEIVRNDYPTLEKFFNLPAAADY